MCGLYNEAMIKDVIRIKLAELLKAREKTLYALAKETNVSYATLWKIANGKVQGITFDVLEKVCANLGCTAGELLVIEE